MQVQSTETGKRMVLTMPVTVSLLLVLPHTLAPLMLVLLMPMALINLALLLAIHKITISYQPMQHLGQHLPIPMQLIWYRSEGIGC